MCTCLYSDGLNDCKEMNNHVRNYTKYLVLALALFKTNSITLLKYKQQFGRAVSSFRKSLTDDEN